ncbi:putative Zinc finger, RING-type, Zinc finger, CHY-type, Zinc finger, RING/FYVE/PHD-type [Plasmopara halstedii]
MATFSSSERKCPHYGRRCYVLAECCKKWVGCRLCHDTMVGDDHVIDRFAIKRMRCNLCQTEQPCAQKCIRCHETMAVYFCSICNLFDDKGWEKKVFHCAQCGICRVGGRENYYHCTKCCGCYPHSLEAKHRCLEGSMHRGCPICLDATFDSLEHVNVLPCGHVMHSSCYKIFLRHSYQHLMSTLSDVNIWKKLKGDWSNKASDEEDDGDSSVVKTRLKVVPVLEMTYMTSIDDDSDLDDDEAINAEHNVWPIGHQP